MSQDRIASQICSETIRKLRGYSEMDPLALVRIQSDVSRAQEFFLDRLKTSEQMKVFDYSLESRMTSTWICNSLLKRTTSRSQWEEKLKMLKEEHEFVPNTHTAELAAVKVKKLGIDPLKGLAEQGVRLSLNAFLELIRFDAEQENWESCMRSMSKMKQQGLRVERSHSALEKVVEKAQNDKGVSSLVEEIVWE